MASSPNILFTIISENQKTLSQKWIEAQLQSKIFKSNLIDEKNLNDDSNEFIELLKEALKNDQQLNFEDDNWDTIKDYLFHLSSTRARKGFSPSETATFIFSLKEPLFELLKEKIADRDTFINEILNITQLIDKLGLYTTEAYQTSREEVIKLQQQELLEISTPVVKLWEGILAVPLIGTLDSARTQLVMENLLQKIVDTGSNIAIIDITGVPAVDTMVAQHLIKTISATRLMGADCIISGIRPQIAQTMVTLGLTMNDVMTRASLADALSEALKQEGLGIKNLEEN